MNRIEDWAATLRADFDRGFAQAPPPPRPPEAGYLAVRIAGEPYAIALDEISGVVGDCRIAPVPSRSASCLGVAALRGEIVAVHALGVLLGHPPAGERPRWLVLAGAAALAFDGFDGCLQFPADSIAPGGQGHIRAVITGEGRLVISIASVMDAIANHAIPQE